MSKDSSSVPLIRNGQLDRFPIPPNVLPVEGGSLRLQIPRRMDISQPLRILVEIPGDYFDLLLAGCAPTDREYTILKNGLVTPYGEGNGSRRTAVILCNEEEAQAIAAFARALSDDIFQHIRQFPTHD